MRRIATALAAAALFAPASASAKTYAVHHCVADQSEADAWRSTPWVGSVPTDLLLNMRTCSLGAGSTARLHVG